MSRMGKPADIVEATRRAQEATLADDMLRIDHKELGYAQELQGLVVCPEDVIDGARFWVVVAMRDAKALAAWLDENGELHTKIYTSVAAAVRKASTSWGR